MHGSTGLEFDMCCRGTEGPLCQLCTLQVSVQLFLGNYVFLTLHCFFCLALLALRHCFFFLQYISPVLFIHPFIYLFIFLCVFELSSANENVLAHWSAFFFAAHFNFRPLISCQLMFSCFFYLAVLSVIHTNRPLLLAQREIWGKPGQATAAGQ